MPYKIKKVSGGYKVHNPESGKTYSKKPHKTRKEALAQQAAMYVNANPKHEKSTKKSQGKGISEGFDYLLDNILENL